MIQADSAVPSVLQFQSGGTTLLVDSLRCGQPAALYWGEAIGMQSPQALSAVALASNPQRMSGGIDVPAPLSLVPQASSGWLNTPVLEGHRSGDSFASKLEVVDIDVFDDRARFHMRDSEAHLALELDLGLTDSGLLHQQATLTNLGDKEYTVNALRLFFPLPQSAVEVLDTSGHHLRERSPQRHTLTIGTYQRESRRGRTGADATVLMAAGVPGFAFESGLVHGVHLAWSGNQRVAVELTTGDDRFFTLEELFEPGEMILAPGASYQTPKALGSWGNGLNELSRRFHDHVRGRGTHPRRPRPITLNTWEAVYFDHDLERLKELADVAARVGVERYVLDDGWFRGRRDDTAGLGDWYVDEDVWPHGLHPLVDYVHSLGMEFGLWVEPEMVNPDSDLARNHPEWILTGRSELPPSARQQQVLNLANPKAYAFIRDRLTALLSEYQISYLKWDHNRDLHTAGSGAGGQAQIHEQTAALYRLMAELKEFQPGLEIESCASGGARVDLGIADVTDRFHTSDCLDPAERLFNQKYTCLVIPPELMGAHLTTPQVHSTGRTVNTLHSGAVAMLGHFGIEWDLTGEDEKTLGLVGELANLYKEHRDIIANGSLVHADLSDSALDVRGAVSPNGDRALFTITQVDTSIFHPQGNIHFPGLEPDYTYEVASALPERAQMEPGQSPLGWLDQPVQMSGAALEKVGLRAPAQYPNSSRIISLRAV